MFLQFDGVNDDIHQKLRGGYFLKRKMDAIENCRQQGLGVVLVPRWCRALMTMSWQHSSICSRKPRRGARSAFSTGKLFRQVPCASSDADRITIPEIIRKLEVQTEDF